MRFRQRGQSIVIVMAIGMTNCCSFARSIRVIHGMWSSWCFVIVIGMLLKLLLYE